MSRPTTLALPAHAAARRLETRRGSFAVLDAAPAPGTGGRGRPCSSRGSPAARRTSSTLLGPLTAAGFRVVAVDGRGQHESPGPRDEKAYAQPELAADVLAQTEALTAAYGSGPLHLLGHSLGGLIVRAALLAADRVPYTSLTLMSSGPAAVTEQQQARTRLLMDFLPTTDMETAWQAMRAMDAESGADGVRTGAEATAPGRPGSRRSCTGAG